MKYRDWTASPQDFEALARLNTMQYPDAPLTAGGVARDWGFVDPRRPTLIRFVVQDGSEVALVETYPRTGGVFLLELIAPAQALAQYGPELLNQARQWARTHGAERWELSLRGSDERTTWLQGQGFRLLSRSTEWSFQPAPAPSIPEGIILTPVRDDLFLQEDLHTLLNAAREEALLTPFTPEEFTAEVLNLGVYRPELLWLAQTPAGDPVGCACLHVWDAGQHGEFSWVHVVPSWRRKGVGAALLGQVSQESNLPHVSVNLPEPHRHLHGLLQTAGFRQQGEWLTAELKLT